METVSFAQFTAIDLRVGLVMRAEDMPESDKLYKLTVDLGETNGEVTIIAGVKTHYAREELVGKKFLFCANLEPRKMMDEVSHGMILAGDVESKPLLIPIDESVPIGTKLR